MFYIALYLFGSWDIVQGLQLQISSLAITGKFTEK